jgi:hypothetical protein
MNLTKAGRRDVELQRRKHGHRTDGRSVFEIDRQLKKRAEEIKAKRVLKQRLQEGTDV